MKCNKGHPDGMNANVKKECRPPAQRRHVSLPWNPQRRAARIPELLTFAVQFECLLPLWINDGPPRPQWAQRPELEEKQRWM